MWNVKTKHTIISLFCLKLAIFSDNMHGVFSFAVSRPEHTPLSIQNKPSRVSEDPIECYLILDNQTENEDAEETLKPESPFQKVVCTSAPKEYAWFNGIDEENMVLLKNEIVASLECVEGASPRGIPEWECR